MSLSPERMSSYRRHFQGDMSASSSLQVRVSNLSPTRKAVRPRSASYSRSGGSFRTLSNSRKPRMTSSVSMRALCFGMGQNLDLDAAAAESQAFLSTRSRERQEMIALNDRLASYIEKVRTLEQQNMLLEAEIDALKSRIMKPSGLRQLYEAQLRDFKRTAEQMRVQRGLALAAKEAMSGQLEVLKVKYEEALEARKKAEMELIAFRPDVDRVTSALITLEKQLANLEGELEFLQRVHKEEIDELMDRIFSSVAKVDVNFALPDLSSALKQIQSQYNSIAAKNLQEMDVWYKSKFHDLTESSTKHAVSIRSVRQEIAGYKKDILNRERDLELLRTRNESLDSQIRDAVEKFKREEEMLQERIEAVKLELKVTKEKIALLLKEHQELLNIKMVLEIEITTYRKLLEGEHSRLHSMIQSLALDAGGKGALTISTSSASLAVGSTPDIAGSTPDVPSPSLLAMGMRSKDDLSGVPGNGSDVTVEVMSSESQTKSYAEELTERKTVLRTVKTDEDIEEKDSQKRNITISGTANED